MLNLLYFAWMRERMGRSAETVAMPAGVGTVGELVAWLSARDEAGAHAFAHANRVRAAVNQDMAAPGDPVADGDEVAFFPPVTGG